MKFSWFIADLPNDMQRGLTTMCLLLIAISLHSWSMVANWKFSIMLKFFLANGETPVWSCGLQFHRNFPSLKNDVLTKRHMGCRLVFKKVGNRLCRLHFEKLMSIWFVGSCGTLKASPKCSSVWCAASAVWFDLCGRFAGTTRMPRSRALSKRGQLESIQSIHVSWGVSMGAPSDLFYFGHSWSFYIETVSNLNCFPHEILYINVPLNVKLRYAVDEEEERVPMTIPRRVPHGDVRPGGLPFRLWCLMTILSQASGFGSTLGYVKYDAKLGIPRNLYDLFNMWDVKILINRYCITHRPKRKQVRFVSRNPTWVTCL